jgi:hypothetical protein
MPHRSGIEGGDPGVGPGARQSIRSWVSCGAKADDTDGLVKALAAARHNAFTLVVDCPVRLKIGTDISKSVFIDDGTTVEFTDTGKITVDNVLIPAFVIADSSNITLTNWNVEYDASLPVLQNAAGKPGNAFNDRRITSWLAANRGIVFDKREGNVNSQWSGPTNICAVFYITGDSSNLSVTGMHLYVPQTAGGERFIPVAFSLGVNFKANQTVTAKTPLTAQYFGLPHKITFSDVELDGTYMGWVGGLQQAIFDNIRSKRYGDLQDANGGSVGGSNKWFAPPHLIYFSYKVDGDPALFNSDIQIRHVFDDGKRVGRARDAGGTDSISGYALSIKLGCVNCSVDDYRSSRPDGFIDVLTCDGLTITNSAATYDSAFLNNLFPGWRFPSPTYKNLKFENVTMVDTAESSVALPIGNANQPSNQGITLKNVRVAMNEWKGKQNPPLPSVLGRDIDVSLDYSIKRPATRIVRARNGELEVTLQGTRMAAQGDTATLLNWSSRNADRCIASGAWSDPVGTGGSRNITLDAPGNHDYVLTCSRGSNTSSVTLPPIPRP